MNPKQEKSCWSVSTLAGWSGACAPIGVRSLHGRGPVATSISLVTADWRSSSLTSLPPARC